jgi:hypothetical protein
MVPGCAEVPVAVPTSVASAVMPSVGVTVVATMVTAIMAAVMTAAPLNRDHTSQTHDQGHGRFEPVMHNSSTMKNHVAAWSLLGLRFALACPASAFILSLRANLKL